MPEYNAEYLRRLKAAVQEFEAAFEAWIGTQNESTHVESRGLFPTVSTKEDADPHEVRRLELDVAAAAGAAARAVQVTGAYIMVSGIRQPVDPISNWAYMAQPKALLDPQNVRHTAANVRGRLDAMIAEAEAASASGPPGFSPSQLHRLIWTAAADYWTTHKRRVAVQQAALALTEHWRDILGRRDVDGTAFWEQTLSAGDPQTGRPKLVWPGDDHDRTIKGIRNGVRPLAKSLTDLAVGATLTIRNPTAHTGTELSEQEGFERLAAYSYLARLLDQCEVRRHPDDQPV